VENEPVATKFATEEFTDVTISFAAVTDTVVSGLCRADI